MLQALQRMLAQVFGIKVTAAEISEGEQLIEAASTFESAVLADVSVDQLDPELIADYSRRTSAAAVVQVPRLAGEALHARGLVVRGSESDGFRATAAAWLLFGPQPANRFPQ